jgi:hypothetical protein
MPSTNMAFGELPLSVPQDPSSGAASRGRFSARWDDSPSAVTHAVVALPYYPHLAMPTHRGFGPFQKLLH